MRGTCSWECSSDGGWASPGQSRRVNTRGEEEEEEEKEKEEEGGAGRGGGQTCRRCSSEQYQTEMQREHQFEVAVPQTWHG
jgi:hypothetical protein